MTLPSRVTVVEVGPRDGLQNEAAAVSIEDRVAFCDALLAAGLPVVEVGALVSPKWVPQMAGSDEVLRRVRRPKGARTPVLVPNRQGFEAARAAGAREIAVFTAASETFNRKNINATIDESFQRFAEFVPEAIAAGMWVRGYGDTIGVGVPTQVTDVMGRLKAAVPPEALAVHFHDTRGTALANVLAALQEGIAVVDSSAGGLGGCPYAPGASGNLATEDLLYMLHGMGIATGVDLARVASASRAIGPRLGRALPSRYLQTCPP
jgi:hydroxymethylglutaryl-CoA lyase